MALSDPGVAWPSNGEGEMVGWILLGVIVVGVAVVGGAALGRAAKEADCITGEQLRRERRVPPRPVRRG